MISEQLKAMNGGFGKRIIVGNTAVVAPTGYYFWSFKCRTDGVIFNELKKGATVITAGTDEQVLKTVALVLNISDGWESFDNLVTSIKLTGAADSITAYLKKLP